jgi:hypothetical protein
VDEQPPQHRSLGLAALAFIAICGSAVGVMIYQLSQKGGPVPDSAGFDIARENAAHTPVSVLPSQTAQSGLGMIKTGGEKLRFGPRENQAGSESRDNRTFSTAVKNFEGKIRALAQSYTQRYPVIAQYGKDWMSYPDLKQLNDDYMRDHDAMKFLRGVARSQNFPKLVSKYASAPAIQSFVKDGIKQAPPEILSEAPNLLKDNGAVRTVISNTASALGLPPALAAGILGGGKIDEKQVMGQILQGAQPAGQTLPRR